LAPVDQWVDVDDGWVDVDPSVGDEARRRLEARGVDPNRPVDTQMASEPGYFAGIWDSFVPSREAALGIVSAVGARGPVEQVKSLYGLGKGVVSAQLEQAGKAKDAYLSGNIRDGMAHSVAAGTPLVGPAVAHINEELGKGNIEYGGGLATGLAASLFLPGAAKGKVAKMTAGAADDIVRAEQQYASVFGKNRPLAQKMTPEMMDRGVVVKDPVALAGEADAAASAIDVDSMIPKGTQIPAKPILDRIKAAQADEFHNVNGQMVPKTPEAEAVVAGLDEYASLIQQHAVNGGIDAQQALELRRLWEKGPGQRGLYTNPDKAVSPTMAVHMDAADSIRPELNALPGVGAANAEKSFQINMQTIAKAAPSTKSIGGAVYDGAKVMAAGGFLHAVPFAGQLVGGATTAYGAVKILRDVPKTAQWKTTSAIHKRNFAKALQSGDYSTAAELGAGIVSGELIADDYGYRAAVQNLASQMPQQTPAVARQVIAQQEAVYIDPEGNEVSVPPGVMTAFASEPGPENSPLSRWLDAMGDQKKIKPGGQLTFRRGKKQFADY
jgi:DNA uptake protein ComE-like DNA-binding protein